MTRTSDAAQVAAVMDAYAEATRARDEPALRALFHEGAVMTGRLGPDLLVGGIEPFLGALRGNEVGPGYVARTTALEVTGDTARAQVVEDDLFGLSFVNDFHLIRDEDGWRIVSKLFHHDPPPGGPGPGAGS